MCGLVGMAGDTAGSWKDLFTELLLFDSMRGMHSTGAGFVSRNFGEDFKLVKQPGQPFNLFADPEYDKSMNYGIGPKVMLGHNRHATIGDKTIENAHPFAFDNVMGMHNGTLDKWCLKDLHQSHMYGTDSEAVFSTINQVGVKEAVSQMFGAWALVWFDKRDHTLNFLRNEKRPLSYCYSADRCTLVWASEGDMLRYLMERRNKKILDNQIYTTEENVHYSWLVPDVSNKKFDQPWQANVKGRTFVQGANWKYEGPFPGKSSGIASTTSSRKGKATSFAMRQDTSKFRPPYKDDFSHVLNKKQHRDLCDEGCCFCGTNAQEWGEFIHILGRYTGRHTPYMCESCYNLQDAYEIGSYALTV